MFGLGYITADEFRAVQIGLDLTDIDDSELDLYIQTASRLVDSECHGSLFPEYISGEEHEWRPLSRRLYLAKWPVISLDTITVYASPTTTFSLSVNDALVVNKYRYVEIQPLAMSLGITTDVIAGVLMTPIVRVSYTAGYSVIPDNVKIATAIIVGSRIAQRRVMEEGGGGALSYQIGSYMVTYGRSQAELAGFAGWIPEIAKMLLRDFVFATVR